MGASSERADPQQVDVQQARLVEALDKLLPQTQCRRCGYADCHAYALAMVLDGEAINRCPPGGAEGIERLAHATGRAIAALDPSCGSESVRLVAHVDEAHCIGCALCIKACPVDCIIGAPKRMHTVIEQDCTGCELCVPVCPVDCIALEPASGKATGWKAWSQAQAQKAQAAYQARGARALRLRTEARRLSAAKGPGETATTAAGHAAVQSAVRAAMERAQRRQAALRIEALSPDPKAATHRKGPP